MMNRVHRHNSDPISLYLVLAVMHAFSDATKEDGKKQPAWLRGGSIQAFGGQQGEEAYHKKKSMGFGFEF